VVESLPPAPAPADLRADRPPGRNGHRDDGADLRLAAADSAHAARSDVQRTPAGRGRRGQLPCRCGRRPRTWWAREWPNCWAREATGRRPPACRPRCRRSHTADGRRSPSGTARERSAVRAGVGVMSGLDRLGQPGLTATIPTTGDRPGLRRAVEALIRSAELAGGESEVLVVVNGRGSAPLLDQPRLTLAARALPGPAEQVPGPQRGHRVGSARHHRVHRRRRGRQPRLVCRTCAPG